ncbi:MAG: tryptophanyl-tRNA synthetase [Amphiamblys sp. WSBS2006]|nr:MAG: tryptophanyl-tRNA synthetase [Amphiamblys sp. WSBS2006]
MKQHGEEKKEQVITPWEVTGGSEDGVKTGIDYKKVMDSFGCKEIPPELLERIERQTNMKVHPFLRRGIFYCHRDLENILDRHEKKLPFFLYTGRGPSSDALQLGHLVPFMFCKYLQDAFGCHVVIQLTDDEKFLVKKDITLEDAKRYAVENAKDIIACGFDPQKTFIFSDIEYYSEMFENILRVQKTVLLNQARAVFGFTSEDCIGKISFPATQIAPCFSSSFKHIFGDEDGGPALIPYAIDQDPYFRVARDIAHRLGFHKPSSICSQFIPGLHGIESKMSASDPTSCIYTTDSQGEIARKITKYAFSGGRDTLAEHRRLGGNTSVDIAYQYLSYFLESDAELSSIQQQYTSGEMLSGELKKRCIQEVQRVVGLFQERRRGVTGETVKQFMAFKK